MRALKGAIPKAATLYFKPSRVQVLTTGAVSAGATAIPVAALSGTIPAGETASYATAWTLNQYTPIWLGMDRDLDCAIKSWLTAFEFVNTPQTRAAIEARCLYLNSLKDVGEVIP